MGDLKPGERPPTLSHSQVHTYGECPEMYRIKYFWRPPRRPAVWFAGGTAFHRSTEWWETERFYLSDGQHPPTFLDLGERFGRFFDEELQAIRETYPDERSWRTAGRKTKEKPNGEDIAFWRELGPALCKTYLDHVACGGWTIAELPDGTPALEVEFTLSLPAAPDLEKPGNVHRIRGAVDQVRFYQGEWLVPTDLKTGSRKQKSNMQLAGYRVALNELFGWMCDKGAYYDARKGTEGTFIDLSKWTAPRLATIYDQVERGIRAKAFPPMGLYEGRCTTCDVKDWCRYNEGPLAHTVREGSQQS